MTWLLSGNSEYQAIKVMNFAGKNVTEEELLLSENGVQPTS